MIDARHPRPISARIAAIFVLDVLGIDDHPAEQSGHSEGKIEEPCPARLQHLGRSAVRDDRLGAGKSPRQRANDIAVVLEAQHDIRPKLREMADQSAEHAHHACNPAGRWRAQKKAFGSLSKAAVRRKRKTW